MVSKSYLHIRAFENTVLFSSMGSPNLQLQTICLNYYGIFKRADVVCFTCCLPQNFSVKFQWTSYFP